MIDHKTIMNGVISGSIYRPLNLDDDYKSYILCESIRLHNKNYKPGKSSETTYYVAIVNYLLGQEFSNIERIINRNKKIDKILS